jgi:hypothetical protein
MPSINNRPEFQGKAASVETLNSGHDETSLVEEIILTYFITIRFFRNSADNFRRALLIPVSIMARNPR